MKVTLGADPEVFFTANGKHVSAIGKVGGSKYEPLHIKDGFFVLEDNVAGEFNVPPVDTVEMFNHTIAEGLKIMSSIANKNGCGISTRASHSFDTKELDCPAALEFGCEPDFNAWTFNENLRPDAVDSNLRSCGGHVHVGGISELDPIRVVRALDLFLGVPSVILDPDMERRKLYGKAGAFRYKDYGVEYRTLSNFWIFEPMLRTWVAEGVITAIQYVTDGLHIESDSVIGALIQHCINESDEDAYKALVAEFPAIAPVLSVAA